MKCAIYCRVSTDEQNPEMQINSLKEYAKNHSYEIFDIYVDTISSRKDKRPQFNKLMTDARYHHFQVVLIWKLDRLGRSIKHLINIAEEWKRRNIDFISITQGFDTTTPGGKMIFHVLGAMAEFEQTLISERTKEGLKTALNVGKRGKDKKQRKKTGYLLRYQKKGGINLDDVLWNE